MDHKIQIVPRRIPSAKAPYHMSVAQLEELKWQLQELETCGFLQPRNSPYGAVVIFMAKKDCTLHMCMDYKSLNKITRKSKYLLPLILDLLDQYKELNISLSLITIQISLDPNSHKRYWGNNLYNAIWKFWVACDEFWLNRSTGNLL